MKFLLAAAISLAAIALFLGVVNMLKSRKQTGNGDGWWSMKYLWVIPLILVGVAIFYFGVNPLGWKSPNLVDVVAMKNAHWLPILVVLTILYFLATRAEKKETEEAAQAAVAIVAIVAFMLFVGFPAWTWVTGPSSSGASQHEANTLSMPPGGKSKRVAVPPGMSIVVNGEDIRLHCVYRDGHEESYVAGERPCTSGDKPFVYATNLRPNEPNIATYSYKK